MTTVVLSLGSNLGDRLARLQAAVDGLGATLRAVSPVFESDPWGGVDQDAFLNAVVVAEDDGVEPRTWLARSQALESANDRVRGIRWGPRTLDVDLIKCSDGEREIRSLDPTLTLPHPQAHRRAFVLVPWLAVDPAAELTVAGWRRPIVELLGQLDESERRSVRATDLELRWSRR